MTRPLVDGFGRRATYLRLSVTDRCDLRCTYCMSENMTFLPRRDILDLEELYRLSRIFIARGGDKTRGACIFDYERPRQWHRTDDVGAWRMRC